MKGTRGGKGEVGESKGEEINIGEGRGGSQGQSHALFAKKDKEGWLECLCRGLSHLIPPSPGQAVGEGGSRQHSREGARADPSEGQLGGQRTRPTDLPKFWILLPNQEFIKSNGAKLSNEQKRRLG